MLRLLVKAHIAAYTKQDGTYVAPHEDKRVAAKPVSRRLTTESFQHAKEFVGQIEKAAEEHGSVFIRWSASDEHDLSDGAASRDYVSGDTHAGLSAVEVTGDMHPVTIAQRLSEYGFVRMSNRSAKPKVYLGEKIGVDSDGQPSIKVTKKLMDVPDHVIAAIDKRFAHAFDLEDDIETLTERLSKMGNTAGAQITRDSLEKKRSKLEEILDREGENQPLRKAVLFLKARVGPYLHGGKVTGDSGLRLMVRKPLAKSLLAKEPPEHKMRRILQSHVDEAKTEDERERADRELRKFTRAD